MRRIPRLEILEDRTTPALLLSGGVFTYASDPGQDLIVSPSASVRFTADVATSHTIIADNAVVSVDVGCTLTCPSISGGFLVGPGSFDVGSISNARITPSATVHAASLVGTVNQGLLTLGDATLSQFTNGSAGRLLVSGVVSADGFESGGQLIVNGKLVNTGITVLEFGAGSVTTVNRVGQLDFVDDGVIDTGLAGGHVVGGLFRNFGMVGSASPSLFLVDAGSKAIGSGYYSYVATQNGGTFSPGGSQSTMATFGGDVGGSVSTTSLTAIGTLTAFDPDAGEAHFVASQVTTLYGSFTITATGQWTYTLDPTRPETVLALAHTGVFNDTISVLTADGTEFDLQISIRS